MEAGKHSYMAEATALLRAAHQVLDEDPKILQDPLAVTLLGDDTEERIQADLERLRLVSKQAFGCHDNQRLACAHQYLPANHMEHLCGCGRHAHLDIVV